LALSPVPEPQIVERKATVRDVPAIFQLIGHWADQRQMLPKSMHTLCNTIREFWVAEEGEEVVGCCALRIYTPELAEVCSLAIAPSKQGRGLGQSLVKCCFEEARAMGIRRVFALTYQVRFFERLGMRVISMDELPEKVWRDCVNCPFLDNCNETALIIEC
jgi:amino-acid N-acetyltransferase